MPGDVGCIRTVVVFKLGILACWNTVSKGKDFQQAGNKEASSIDFREARSHYKSTFLKDHCRDTIKFTFFVGVRFTEDDRKKYRDICISLNNDLFLSVKSDKGTQNESRVIFNSENLFSLHSLYIRFFLPGNLNNHRFPVSV